MTHAAPAPLPHDEGFSLIEMIVVVAILSLGMTAAFLTFQAAQRPKTAEAVAREITHLIQFIRLDAVNSRRQRSLVVDMATRTISNERGDRRLFVPAGIEITIVTGRELIRSGNRAVILFLPDGTSSGGEMSFESGGAPVILRIPWLTGIPSLEPGEKAYE
ncbi:prepilin-type N-terminal cleavage/methylation domain-containing protein [Agrobacterium tumefaciens]|uniref:prepilin-type N-terminal cleavage/methylation domain-containing protein n=1 Tax=Agrobacterium tumefaciens TaxID=358 RepID=UPI00122FB8C5|nr:prepilin-type N-terminal cleavage/methylation domain-containing protein [Agrobacterium tumefaciens]